MTPEAAAQLPSHLLQLSAQIVSAHVSHNDVAADEPPHLVTSVLKALAQIDVPGAPIGAQDSPTPAVPIKRSVFPEHIVCLEDGAKLTMLTRYLKVRFNLTPAQYRRRWSLPASYPMVAPGYAARRSAQAKRVGLGGKRPAPAAAEGKGRAEGARA